MDKLTLFRRATRFQVIPVMILPVAIGSVGAWVWNGRFDWLLFLITIIGAGAAHLFSNMINDLWDYRSGVDVAARETAATISTNSGFLANGTLSVAVFAAMTWSLFGIAAVCGVLLTVLSGYEVLLFAGLGGLIAYFYVAPPIRFGYRGKGYSELAIVIAFGVLPVMGSHFVQTSELDWRSLWASLPIGLLTTLILFNHHFLHWRADQAAGKKTLVVVFGEARALQFSKLLLALAYLALIAAVLLHSLPYYALIGLITILPFIRIYRALQPSNPSPAYLPLMGVSVKAAIRCGAILVVCLAVQGILAAI
ncbi:prenyltransferase [Paenibacillus koleovorans]|uniref:prenyltransferase n=1 Tax=Paenibacillus koleovorans TaxID=121608 RepID=UPI000FD99BB2|nr:prenyltransferase [Paenibacillus koleovorans]